MALIVRFVIGVGGTHSLDGVCIEVVMVFPVGVIRRLCFVVFV